MKTFSNSLVLALCFFVSHLTFSQVIERVPVVSNDHNWMSSISYDLQGNTISKGVNYFNELGKATQQQSWDILTGRVWNTEVRYDSFNRPVLQTLSAPINNTATFGFRPDFIMVGNAPLSLMDYDGPLTYFSPSAISGQVNTLGWYYSNQNTLDPYQDVTDYPYIRTLFSNLNPGSTQGILGGNKVTINNQPQWLQSFSFSMVAEKPISTSDVFYTFYDGRKVMKTVTRDVQGGEAVVYSDTDGNVLGAARSGYGGISGNALSPKNVYSEIMDKGYVDIHISEDCTGITFSNLDLINKHNIRIFNLITEVNLGTVTGNSFTLSPGFYRIEDTNNYYGKNNTTATPVAPVKVNYTVSYFDLTYNEYDISNRVIKSVQPQGSLSADKQESVFKYNTLGQLLETTSVDEGTSKFLYRRDGQIRFSQNAKQAKENAFSYTNYDNLGRPIESGVYKGTDVIFSTSGLTNYPNAIRAWEIVDDSDGLPLSDRSEQNFTVYDLFDSNLMTKLQSCNMPLPEFKQTFLSGNVSYTYTENPKTNKTWYSYDVYGRVKWMIQEIEGLSCLKTINYEYNPVNGNLIKVDYQRYNSTERFVHLYDYNAAGQLTDVSTSKSGSFFTHQAHYNYNESGALIRTELADDLQGIDYVYNLSGQLKAINHPSLLAADDPGNDGNNGFAADVFGMQLDYFSGDYSRNNSPKPIVATPQGIDQYNGNIKAARWNTNLPSTTQNAYIYQYNKKNWLTGATFGAANSSALFTPNADGDYNVSNITYDSNGNIQTLKRKGYTDGAGSNSMDSFNYHYDYLKKNRLLYVKDTEDNVDVNRYSDLRDQQVLVQTGGNTQFPFTNLPNYVYNDLGQLEVNIQDKISYEYYASGLISRINSLDTQNTGTYINLEYRKYDVLLPFQDTKRTWGGSRASSPETIFLNCMAGNDLMQQQFGESLFLRLLGSGDANTKLRIAPNTFMKVSFDLVVDKYLYIDPLSGGGELELLEDENGVEIIPTIVVNLKKPDGTLISTQTINARPADLCDRYFAEHINFEFTSGNDGFVILELIRSHNLASVPDGQTQQVFIDNISSRAALSTKVAYFYNDRGHRIRKESYSGENTYKTYYVADASGTVLAVYNGASGSTIRTGPPTVTENGIYGNGRIGVFKRDSSREGGYSLYEISDHLGNVRAVIMKAGAALVSLTNKADYYPFGMPMPNKHTTDGNYRYAFQGQEKDGETGMEAFELRLWDARLGRWLTVDPQQQYPSPYLGMGNNPISRIDPDGGADGGPGDPPPTVLEELVINVSKSGIGQNIQYGLAWGATFALNALGTQANNNVSLGAVNLPDASRYGEFEGAARIGRLAGNLSTMFQGGGEVIGAGGAEVLTFGGATVPAGIVAVHGGAVAAAGTVGTGKEILGLVNYFSKKGHSSAGSGNFNFKKISDSLLKSLGIDAHAIKYEFLGKKAPVAQYDLYVNNTTKEIFIFKKGGKGDGIATGHYIK